LRLVFRLRDETYLAEQQADSPWRVARPFALPGGGALLQLSQVGPGIMGGDRYRLEVVAEEGASVVLVGSSASKVHGMPEDSCASLAVSLTAQEGATLEYYPGLCIPFRGADFTQHVTANLDPSARFATLELWAAGRKAHGEQHQFRRISARTRVNVAGRPLYRDAMELDPAVLAPGRHGLFEGYDFALTGFWRGSEGQPARESVRPGFLLATGPTEGGIYARGLAREGLALATEARALVQERRAGWGLAPLVLERFSSAFG